MKLSFTKMQGCANDYIYLDCRESGVPENIAALSQDLSRRHFSIGADGIICICAPVTAGADGRMRIFNADGSEAQMCGNGVRCVAEWLYTHGVAKETLVVDTNSGTRTITRKGRQLWQVEMGGYSAMAAALPAVNMGEGPLVDCPLTVEDRTWRVTCISVGNPHCVTMPYRLLLGCLSIRSYPFSCAAEEVRYSWSFGYIILNSVFKVLRLYFHLFY